MSRARSNEEKLALFEGVSISVLAQIFGKDKRAVSEAIKSVRPSGMRGGYPVYALRDVAKYLVEPVVDIEQYLAKANPKNLPAEFQKDYWTAMLNRQKYEQQKGELWPTGDVLRVFSDVFKKFTMGVRLFSDSVESRTELTEKQRQIINELADGLLNDMRTVLIEHNFDADEDSTGHLSIAD